MEHLNRLCKNAMSGMGANVTGQSIQRVGRAIKVLSETMQELDKHFGIRQESDFHTTRSSDKDLNKRSSRYLKRPMFFHTFLEEPIGIFQTLFRILCDH